MAGHSLPEMRKSGPTDPELLADWLKHQREPAFRELVARYAGLVQATALRSCGNESLAAEVTQLTFITLARKARSLTSCKSLGGWLHRTAILQSKNLIRQSHRENIKRQNLSHAMEVPLQNAQGELWNEMQPILDEALTKLSDKDREAILLRFYRSLTVREIAETLGITNHATQKRIDRAIERLREKLTRRGVQVAVPLASVLLAGFTTDAQAATLPISTITSKAIAASSVGGGTIAVAAIAIVTFMKSTSAIPPLAALILAGAWTGSKYSALSTAEANNSQLLATITAFNSRPSNSGNPAQDDGPINWEMIAKEDRYGSETKRLELRLKSMSQQEMIAALDRISQLECSMSRRIMLQNIVINPLIKLDPEWVLNHFEDQLRNNGNQPDLNLIGAFREWAQKDLVAATQWFDSKLSNGAFVPRSLGHERNSKSRYLFESALLNLLLGSDPDAAGQRLATIPNEDRVKVLSGFAQGLLNTPLDKRENMADFADLVRSLLPAEEQINILFKAAPYSWDLDDFPQLSNHLQMIEATPNEQIACIEKFAGRTITNISNHRKVAPQDIDRIREWIREISTESVDKATGRALTEAIHHGGGVRLDKASEIAVNLLEAEGTDEVLATLLETAKINRSELDPALFLTNRISDEERRAAIVKHLKSLTFP